MCVCGLGQLPCCCQNTAFPVAAAMLYETRLALLPLGYMRSDGRSLALRVLTLQIKETSIQLFFFLRHSSVPSPPAQTTNPSFSICTLFTRKVPYSDIFYISTYRCVLYLSQSFTLPFSFYFYKQKRHCRFSPPLVLQ